MEKQFVGFEIVKNKYCVDIMDVKEVVREDNITLIPDSPKFVEGIMNLRNIVVPVISIQEKLGIKKEVAEVSGLDRDKKKQGEGYKKLIIVNIDNVMIGLTVNNLDRVFSIDTAEIQEPEIITDTGIDKTFINGVIKHGSDVYLMLDVKKLLDFSELSFIEKEVLE